MGVADLEAFMDGFSWSEEQTPAGSWKFAAAAVGTYLVVIFCLRWALGARKSPVPLGPIPAVHNLILCLGSLAMFLGTLEASNHETALARAKGGNEPLGPATWLFCLPVGTPPKGRLFFWSYIYYLSKFYELLDTLILVLRRKPLSFLHVYHHATVVFMCYFWLRYSQSLQTIALLTNTGIHVIMYWYYFMHTIGSPPPWRKFVTNGQIIQFLFSFMASMPFLWLHFYGPGCEGYHAWLFNVAFNFTLLLLFMNFYRAQYLAKKKTAKTGKRE